MWNKGWAGRLFTFSSNNLGREQRRGRRWGPAFWKSTRELFFTQGGFEKRVGHASVDPVLGADKLPVSSCFMRPRQDYWQSKKKPPKQQHTLGQESFPLGMAKLAPKTQISVGRRQDDHQKVPIAGTSASTRTFSGTQQVSITGTWVYIQIGKADRELKLVYGIYCT